MGNDLHGLKYDVIINILLKLSFLVKTSIEIHNNKASTLVSNTPNFHPLTLHDEEDFHVI